MNRCPKNYWKTIYTLKRIMKFMNLHKQGKYHLIPIYLNLTVIIIGKVTKNTRTHTCKELKIYNLDLKVLISIFL